MRITRRQSTRSSPGGTTQPAPADTPSPAKRSKKGPKEGIVRQPLEGNRCPVCQEDFDHITGIDSRFGGDGDAPVWAVTGQGGDGDARRLNEEKSIVIYA